MIDREFLKFQWKQQTGAFEKRQVMVSITRDGVPTAVLLSMEHFEGLMETLDILSDQKTMRPLRKSLKQARSGRWETHESVLVGESE